jgi:crotonobetainyl-CoA:carnitine CoA-transferase CaiB-like acyl-CoA transferase
MQILQNIQVLSLAINLPGPLAVARLKALGARVRKIEPPGGDPLQRAAPDWYRLLHQGIEIRRLNLKDAEGRVRLNDFLEQAELLLTASRPAALERLGLAWNDLHSQFPRLSQVAIIGHPEPHQNLPGHDLLYQAEQGLLQPPTLPRTCLADLGGALEAVIAALQLLFVRSPAQPGQLQVVSLAGAGDWFAEPLRHGLTASGGTLAGGFAGYGIYRTAQGWIALAVLEPHFQQALIRELGIGRLDTEELQRIFLIRTAEEWVAWAQERDLPIAKVLE